MYVFFATGHETILTYRSLRAMLYQFAILMFAAIFILYDFSAPSRLISPLMNSVGFWHALYTLDEGNYGVWEIAEYMVNIWFGLDSTGFDISSTSSQLPCRTQADR
jgi:hypothetical protein